MHPYLHFFFVAQNINSAQARLVKCTSEVNSIFRCLQYCIQFNNVYEFMLINLPYCKLQRNVFSFEWFNRVQSSCFDIAYRSDANMVLSAPTGEYSI